MIANVGLPAFFPHSLATLTGIFLIAAIEGWFIMRGLKLNYAESYRHALNANWKSTIAGIPLAWLLWFVGLIPLSMGLSVFGVEVHPAIIATAVKTVVIGATMPTEWANIGSAIAWIVMLIPFWLGSVWIERRTLIRRLPDCERSQISTAIVRGNLASYCIFLAIGLVALLSAIGDFPNQKQRYKEWREFREAHRNQLDEHDITEQADTPESKSKGDLKDRQELEGISQ